MDRADEGFVFPRRHLLMGDCGVGKAECVNELTYCDTCLLAPQPSSLSIGLPKALPYEHDRYIRRLGSGAGLLTKQDHRTKEAKVRHGANLLKS